MGPNRVFIDPLETHLLFKSYSFLLNTPIFMSNSDNYTEVNLLFDHFVFLWILRTSIIKTIAIRFTDNRPRTSQIVDRLLQIGG